MGLFRAIRFLTIAPLPSRAEVNEEDLGRSSAWFPLTGTLIGAAAALGAFLFRLVWPPLVVHVLVLTLWVLLTRGLHLDGLADTADGLGGGWSREERLAIMKDSRVGVFGLLAVVILLLLKLAFLVELEERLYLRGLVLAPTLGRWGMLLAMFVFPAAPTGGMGERLKRHCRAREVLIGTVTALIAAYAALQLWGLAIAGGVGLACAFLAWRLGRTVGGLTGDIYGALCETGELAALALVALPAGLGCL